MVEENQHWFAYMNRCPHQGIKLDWDNDQFLDYDGELIQCATHGALFVMETGTCVAGPCIGTTLQPIDVKVHNGGLYISANI